MRETKDYKVFCVGLNKTGTTTIGKVFKSLKIRTVGFEPKLVNTVLKGKYSILDRKLRFHDGFQDFPFPLIYEEIFRRYRGEARFVLSTRKSPEVWLRSLKRHSLRNGGLNLRTKIYGYPFPHLDEQAHLDFYNRHNDTFVTFAERHRCNFVTTVVGEDNLFEKICPLLSEEVPRIASPETNMLRVPTNPNNTRFIKYLDELNHQLELAGKSKLSINEALDI